MVSREYVKQAVEEIESQVHDFMMTYPKCQVDCFKRIVPYTLLIIPFELAFFFDAINWMNDLSISIIIFSILGLPVTGIINMKKLSINRNTNRINLLLKDLMEKSGNDYSIENYSKLVTQSIDLKIKNAIKWRKRSILIPLAILGLWALIIGILSLDSKKSSYVNIQQILKVENNTLFKISNIEDTTKKVNILYQDDRITNQHYLKIDTMSIDENFKNKQIRLSIVREDSLLLPYIPKFVFNTSDESLARNIISENYTSEYQVFKMLESFQDTLFYKIEIVD